VSAVHASAGLPRRPLREPPRNDSEKKRKAWIATPRRARNDNEEEREAYHLNGLQPERFPYFEHTRIVEKRRREIQQA
jgi:hypothetical protein